MNQGNLVSRVRSGVPWWLWLIAGAMTLAVVVGILSAQKKEDPGDLFDRAVTAAERSDIDTLAGLMAELAGYEGHQDEVTVLQGIEAALTNRDPKAVRLLNPFLDHKEERLRGLAIGYSATCCRRIGDAVQARDLLLKAVSLAPSDAQIHRQLAEFYENVGALQPAFEEAERVLELDPEYKYATQMMARLHMEQGRLEKAIEIYESVLDTPGKRISSSPDTVKRYLGCLLRTGRADTALVFLDDNPSIVTEPGVGLAIFMECGETSRARDVLELMGFNDPNSSLMVRLKAQDAVDEENWDKAIGLLAQGILVAPRNRPVFELLQLSASKNNMPELEQVAAANLQAIRDLEKQYHQAIVDIGDDVEDADLRLNVARLATELGKIAEARHWTASAGQVDPARQAKILAKLGETDVMREPLVPFEYLLGRPDSPD